MEAVGATVEEGFGGEVPERQQTAGPAAGMVGEPGWEHWMRLGEVATAGWWGLPSSCWELGAGSGEEGIKINRTKGDYMLKADLKQSSVKIPMTAQQITGWTVQKPGQGLLERKKLGKALSVCLNERSVGWKNIWCETKSQPRKLVFFSTVLLHDSFISNFSWIWQK